MVSSSAIALLLLLSIPKSLATSPLGISLLRPLSQQFPPVARVKQAFSWTFSDSTIQSSSPTNASLSLQYTALTLPSWLAFSGSNLSFSGCPTESDTGSYAVEITATTPDGQSRLTDTVTLAVTDRNGTIEINDTVSNQLVTNN